MKILLAEHYGLCFGVRDALARAEALATEGPLTILGELVHNPLVTERLHASGARLGSLQDQPDSVDGRVLITAHGASDVARSRWTGAGVRVADATCPLVRHAHEQLRVLVASGFTPVVIGQRTHVEVQGLIGDFPGAFVVEDEGDIPTLPAAISLGIISQTTQISGRVRTLVTAIVEAEPAREVRFVDTVCQPTKNRQLALGKILAECELIVVVGGRHSNNTRQLVVTATALGRRAVHVERAAELRPEDFVDVASVGVTAGTSTLKETVAEVVARLEEMGGQAVGAR